MCVASALLFGFPAAAQQFGACNNQIASVLGKYGLTAAEMKDVSWQTEFFANSRSPEMGGYQFEGRPASCASGKLIIELWRSCQVANTYVSGDCQVERISH